MPANPWVRFLRSYGPIPNNDAMYDESIQRSLGKQKIRPLRLPAPHLHWLIANFRSAAPQSVILTGTAGDGKTYNCRSVWDALGGSAEIWNRGGEIQRIAVGVKELIIVKDLSELTNEDSLPLIDQMADDLADAASPRLYLIAANHGQLLDKLKAASPTVKNKDLVRVVEDLLVTGRTYHASISLELRDLSRTAAASLVDDVIDQITGHEGWDSCKDCPGLAGDGHACPIRENRRRLIGEDDGRRFRTRLAELVDLSEHNGGHFTVRQLLSLVTNVILGHPDCKDGLMSCSDVSKILDEGSASRASLYRNVFGANLKSSRGERMEPFKRLNLFGIGAETSNTVDNLLVYGRDDPDLIEEYKVLVAADPIYGETLTYQNAQRAYLEGEKLTAVESFVGLLRGQRQRLFFTIPPERIEDLELWDLTVFRFAGLYLETIRALAAGQAASRPVMSMVVRGLNRIFTGMLVQNQDDVVLASSGSQSQARTSPLLEEFISVARRGGQEVTLKADRTGGLELSIRVSREDDPGPVTLPLSVTRFEFLGRVAEGALPSSFSLEVHEDLLAFKARLLSAVERRRVLDGDTDDGDLVLQFIVVGADGRATHRSVTVRP